MTKIELGQVGQQPERLRVDLLHAVVAEGQPRDCGIGKGPDPDNSVVGEAQQGYRRTWPLVVDQVVVEILVRAVDFVTCGN